MAQALLSCSGITLEGPVGNLARNSVVRLTLNGFFFMVVQFFKPLLGYKVVCGEKGDLELTQVDPSQTLALVKNMRYFGSHRPSYFSMDGTGVIAQLWSPKFGIACICFDALKPSDCFYDVVNPEEAEQCLGANSQVSLYRCTCAFRLPCARTRHAD